MKHTIIIVAILLAGCSKPLEKPFSIISKGRFGDTRCDYIYQDGKGQTNSFTELSNKYNVGDTLK